jgi:alkyl hydroperoxide reductase subunit AhpC
MGRRHQRDTGLRPNYPLIGDPELKIAKPYGMLPADVAGTSDERTAVDNQTVRKWKETDRQLNHDLRLDVVNWTTSFV